MGSVGKNAIAFAESGMDRYIGQGLKTACALVRNEAVNNVPVKTGNLQRGIDFEVEGADGVVYATADYAPYVEVGTGIYSSKGNGRKTPWVFPYYKEGETAFARTEGIKPQPFLEPAVQENKARIQQCFEGLF